MQPNKTYIVFDNDIAVSHCNVEQSIPSSLRQLAIITKEPSAYLGISYDDALNKTDNEIVSEYVQRNSDKKIAKQKANESLQLKSNILYLIDEIKLAKELDIPVDKLSIELELAKQKYKQTLNNNN